MRHLTRACILALMIGSCTPPAGNGASKPDVVHTPAPGLLHLVSGPAHYLIESDLLSMIGEAGDEGRGVTFHNGIMETAAPVHGGCGTTSNITAKGARWTALFKKPSGLRGDNQVIAVGVDRMETAVKIPTIRRRISAQGYEVITSRRVDWTPPFSTKPAVETMSLCDQTVMPKTQSRRWTGGTMLCDPNPSTNIDPKHLSHECYIELPMHGTTWMTEFYLPEGEQPDDQVSYARRFIDSINLPDDGNTPETFTPRDASNPDGSLDKYRKPDGTLRSQR